MCVTLWCRCTAIYVVCLSTCVWICVCDILDVPRHVHVCVYFLSFTFFSEKLSQMSNPVVLRLLCIHSLQHIHTGLLTTYTAASLTLLDVKCFTQGPLDSDCWGCRELLLHFPSLSSDKNWQPSSHKPSSLSVCTYEQYVFMWLTINGFRVEGKCRVQWQTVHSHLPTLNAVPVVSQRCRAVELVMETCSGAVVHTNEDIIQSPLGGVFPYKDREKEVRKSFIVFYWVSVCFSVVSYTLIMH